MRLPAPFVWSEDHIAIHLAGGSALFTTRRGGCSEGPYASLNVGLASGDVLEHVHANRARVAALAGRTADRLACARQVHGSSVSVVTEPLGEALAADGQATSREDIACMVVVADCLPIALVARDAVAILHAGWRGLAAGVVGEGVAALRALGAGGPIAAAIGPGARRCCYAAGQEVRTAFARHGHGSEVWRRDRVDLPAIAERELRSSGVAEIHDIGLCTICAPADLLFSHRRDRGTTGRQAGVVWRS